MAKAVAVIEDARFTTNAPRRKLLRQEVADELMQGLGITSAQVCAFSPHDHGVNMA